MLELIKRRRISTEKILSWFGESSKYHSTWFMALTQLENVYAYYEMLYLGEGSESSDIENLSEAHPLRVVPLYKHLKRLDENSVSIYGEKFYIKELEVVTLTTGKLNVRQIVEKVSLSMPEVIEILNRLEENFLIVYNRY